RARANAAGPDTAAARLSVSTAQRSGVRRVAGWRRTMLGRRAVFPQDLPARVVFDGELGVPPAVERDEVFDFLLQRGARVGVEMKEAFALVSLVSHPHR